MLADESVFETASVPLAALRQHEDDESVFETGSVPLSAFRRKDFDPDSLRLDANSDQKPTHVSSEKNPRPKHVTLTVDTSRVRFSLPHNWTVHPIPNQLASPPASPEGSPRSVQHVISGNSVQHVISGNSVKHVISGSSMKSFEVEEPVISPVRTPTTPQSPWSPFSPSSPRRERKLTLALRSGMSVASGRTTQFSGRSSVRSRARSSMVSLGYSEVQPHDHRRRPSVWVTSFLVTALVVAVPLAFLTRKGRWCLRLSPDIMTWLLPPFFAAGLIAAFIDHRGRYSDDLLLHYWMWKQAQAAYLGSLASTAFHVWSSFRGCELPGVDIAALCITFCGLGWVLSVILLNFCIVLKLRTLEQHVAANRCFLLLKLQACLIIPGAIGWGSKFCQSLWKMLGMEWFLRANAVLSIFGVLSMITLFPFFYFADAAMRESAHAADEDVATGAVPLIERPQVKRAASWTRWTASATKASGISILMILLALITFHFRKSLERGTDYTLFLVNLSITTDMALNSVCASLLSGLLGPRLHYLDAKVSLVEAGRLLEARRQRDAQEMELASAQLEKLHLIPVSDGLQEELHALERKLSESYRFQMSMRDRVQSYESVQDSEASDWTAAVSLESEVEADKASDIVMQPQKTQELFEEYRSRCDVEMARMMDLMQSCCTAYQVLTERWQFITEIENFVDQGFSTQVVSDKEYPRPPPEKMEEGVYSYFVDLYQRMADATDAFHRHFGSVVEEFENAKSVTDINLDDSRFPFTIHRKGKPMVQQGPLKIMDRARAKYEEKPDGKTAWPPKAATLLDLIRTTVLFQDPYDLAVFMHFMRSRFRVVRVKNRFKDFDPNLPGGFRNVHTNIIFEHAGKPLVVEVQLHLWALFVAAKMIHGAYEVVRAETLAEVVGPPYKWTDDHSEHNRDMIMKSQTTMAAKKKANSLATIAFAKFKTYSKGDKTPGSDSKRTRMKSLFGNLLPRRDSKESAESGEEEPIRERARTANA